jgi:hypothetical protein
MRRRHRGMHDLPAGHVDAIGQARVGGDRGRLLCELRASGGVAETETRLVLRDLLRRTLPG